MHCWPQHLLPQNCWNVHSFRVCWIFRQTVENNSQVPCSNNFCEALLSLKKTIVNILYFSYCQQIPHKRPQATMIALTRAACLAKVRHSLFIRAADLNCCPKHTWDWHCQQTPLWSKCTPNCKWHWSFKFTDVWMSEFAVPSYSLTFTPLSSSWVHRKGKVPATQLKYSRTNCGLDRIHRA